MDTKEAFEAFYHATMSKKKVPEIKESRVKCPMCGQKMDMYTTVHKNVPFVDNKTYARLCFTCYFVPTVLEQKYDKNGNVSEELEVPYSFKNLSSPKDLYESGAADTLKQAKICVEAVKNACLKAKEDKKPRSRPKADWNIF